MITVIVSAIGGQISLVVFGWLGGSGMLWKWLRNLVPTSVGMLDISVSLGTVGYAKDGVYGRYLSIIVREWFAE